MQTTVHQEVATVLTEKVGNRESFTAYEITQEARRRVGRDTNIGHREVRDFVRNDFSIEGDCFSPDYRMTPVELNVDGNPEALMYHPPENDPCDHPLVDCVQGQRQSDATDGDTDDSDDDTDEEDQIGDTASVSAYDDSTCTQPDGSFVGKVNKGNELVVPMNLLSKITVSAGSYDVIIGGNTNPRKPEKDGRVRIHRKWLNSTADKFTISVDTSANTITIAEVQ